MVFTKIFKGRSPNALQIGAVIGTIIGMTPPLHRAFFNEPQKGGIFTAWLTESVSKIGALFAALQVVVVGVKLSSSLRKMRRGEEGGKLPWLPTTVVLFVRFVIWPAYDSFSHIPMSFSLTHPRKLQPSARGRVRELMLINRTVFRYLLYICLRLGQPGFPPIPCCGLS